MRVLLLVEGQSDRATLPTLARRFLQPSIGVDSRLLPQGDMLSARTVEAHIRAAINQQRDTHKVLICIDSEYTDVDVTRARIDNVVQTVAGNLPSLVIEGVVVDHALEGWLLQDRRSIAGFLGMVENRMRYRNPETGYTPATTMRRLFNQVRRDFIKTSALPSLAERVDVDLIARTSPTFERFRDILLQDPANA